MVLINELIGSFGKYHLWLCFIVFMCKFGVAFHQMAIIFLAPPVQYRCPLTNTSCCTNPEYNKTLFIRTIVTEWNLICENAWLKDFTQTVFQFGVLLGSLLFGIASDRYGRKPTLITSVILEIFTGILTSFLPDFWSFTIVRMILGFSVGGIMVVSFVMIMEFVGNANRDVISALIHVPFTIGYVLLAGFGYFIRDYMYFQLAISASNVFLLCYICILPETPRWLLLHRSMEAVSLIEKVAKINGRPTEDIQRKIDLYQLEHQSIRENKGSVIDLFRKPNLRRNMMIMCFIWFVASYCFYGVSHYISHLTGDVFINVVASGVVCLCACLIIIPLMKFMNRKTIVIIGNLSCSFCLFIIAIVPEGKASLVFGCTGVLFCYMVFIIVYLYCSEMFPTVVRNAALGISSMMARFGAMIAPFVANFRWLGKWCAPVAFGIFPLFAALLCFLLPETKDCELMMTVEEGEAFASQHRERNRNVTEQ